MMSSVSAVNMQKPNLHQNVQTAVVLKTQQQSHYDTLVNTASKEVNLKFGYTPSQMSNSERIKETNPKVQLQQRIQFPNFKVKDGVQTIHLEAQLQVANKAQGAETGTGRHGSGAKASHEEAERVDKVTQLFASKSHLSTTVSSTSSLVAETERFTSSPPPLLTAHTQAITAVTNAAVSHTLPTVMFVPTSPLHCTKSALPVHRSVKMLKVEESVTPQGAVDLISTSSSSTSSPATSHSLSLPLPSFSALTSSSAGSNEPNVKTLPPNVTLHSNTSTTTESLLSLSLSRRPVCPYPPVPIHGTFYFRNVENPRPREYKHYIQYACYSGYTLAHGDIHSYCQQEGTWSGITPVCLGE